ncbi:tryptophanase [Clostridium algidicarnis]|uniref:Tryptophanase n=1 Tax=Clostridium algidicarnis TaxID=37659 RepID=A0ABS6C1W2_9CLOT|nr:tryptophanase [Clostridium algidicarnis]MBB6631390.1 tryptophanase [Clostridium algidicarnis]MBU3219479.1 tryptophanase [Clostridium algidicarnis]MCB2287031.1 tryptophanase [Clostridium algidicarnis]
MNYVEPYKIKMIEYIEKGTLEERKRWIKEANYNLYNLKSNQVFINLIFDSGTGSMSNIQWAEIMLADESYAGESSYFYLKEIVYEIMGCDYCLPTHQGRGAENIICSTLIEPGDIIPSNIHYSTTSSNIKNCGGKPVNCIVESAYDIETEDLFKGNIDVEKLKNVIDNNIGKIPFIILTITCNTLGSQPVSMSNIKDVSKICKENNILLFLDASRFAENAYSIKMIEESYREKGIKEIVNEMFSYSDGFIMSCKKDGLSTTGGIVGLKNKDIFMKAKNFCLLYEGYFTHGGMSSRDLKMIGRGIKEAVDFNCLDARSKQVFKLGKKLDEIGIPIVKPYGGHAIYIDARKFYENVPLEEYPAQLLGYELYLEGGVRGNASNIKIKKSDVQNSTVEIKNYSLLRLSIPRRTYTDNHIMYVAEVLYSIWEKRESKSKGFLRKDKGDFFNLNNYTMEFVSNFK